MTTSLKHARPGVLAQAGWDRLAQLAGLFKLRIVALLLLAALGGAFLGSGGRPGWEPVLALILAGGSASAGASALNQYFERHSDGKMGRTARRPLVTGQVKRPAWVLLLGALLVLLPVTISLPFNADLAFFVGLGAFIYVGVYTLWLKPRSLLNIVIGGAAGSAAVLSGGAAVGNWQEPSVVILSLLIFLWTPSHFWSLALLYRKDYQQAGMPMLPARTSRKGAAWWVLLHTCATVFAGLVLTSDPSLGLPYAILVGATSIYLLLKNVALLRHQNPRNAKSLFLASNYFLLVLLISILLDSRIS